MGYNTDYTGVIGFSRELKGSEITHLEPYLHSQYDRREDPNNTDNVGDFNWIDLEFSGDFMGLEYNGSEKSRNMEGQLQFAINRLVEKAPDVMCNGEMLAQGEEHDDRYKIIVTNNKVTVKKIVLKGKKVVCPNCNEEFILEEEK